MTFRIKTVITSVNKNNETIHQLQFILTTLIKVEFKRVKFTKIDLRNSAPTYDWIFILNGNIIVKIQKSALLSLTMSQWQKYEIFEINNMQKPAFDSF